MEALHRALAPRMLLSIAEYRAGGGGQALPTARALDPDLVIDLVTESGLRGRGGGGSRPDGSGAPSPRTAHHSCRRPSSSTEPRVSRARSRTGRSCAAIRTVCSKAAVDSESASAAHAEPLDTPVSYEAMQSVGSGLGAAGFIVFDDTTDLVAVAAGVSRFLAVESSGQCLPCKRDGLIVADLLASLRSSTASARDLEAIDRRLDGVTRGARCYLATQHQVVVQSILGLFHDEVRGHLRRSTPTDSTTTAPTSRSEHFAIPEPSGQRGAQRCDHFLAQSHDLLTSGRG